MTIQHAKNLARNLLDQYELFEWEVATSRDPVRAGRCFRPLKIIELSRLFILYNEVEVIRDLILHEVAHALTPGNHGVVWRTTFMMMGGSGMNTPPGIKGRFVAHCRSCGHDQHTMTVPLGRVSCARCGGKDRFNPAFQLVIKERKVAA